MLWFEYLTQILLGIPYLDRVARFNLVGTLQHPLIEAPMTSVQEYESMYEDFRSGGIKVYDLVSLAWVRRSAVDKLREI